MGGGGASSVKAQLVGYDNFKRHNPRSDKFPIYKFHHVEFWCADATNTSHRFQHGLGMTLVGKSDQSTGNPLYASYVLKSNDLVFAFTAPYSRKASKDLPIDHVPLKQYDQDFAYEFLAQHGLAVRAIGLLVGDAKQAYQVSVENGAVGVMEPVVLEHPNNGTKQTISEVQLYGDVVLRYVSGDYQGPFLASYEPIEGKVINYGLQRLDHAVGNTHQLLDTVNYIMGFTGFHEFAEFVAEDVGTVDSGLNSMVLANNNEMVLLPINEPTFGTRRKSQIQTYLEQNEGPGLQHLALKTDDIITTLRQMQSRSEEGGFGFMPRPGPKYYKELPSKIGPVLTPEQYAACEVLGILVDKDDQGVLLQIFTRPLGDRPTIFLEIIERLCQKPLPTQVEDAEQVDKEEDGLEVGGCGGFGKGNFSELFKSIEDYERTLDV